MPADPASRLNGSLPWHVSITCMPPAAADPCLLEFLWHGNFQSCSAPGHAAGLRRLVEGAGGVRGAHRLGRAGAAARLGEREPVQALIGVAAGHARRRRGRRVVALVGVWVGVPDVVLRTQGMTSHWPLVRALTFASAALLQPCSP